MTTFEFSPENLRKRFHALCDQRDVILAKSAPMRAERDAYQNEADAEIRAMNAEIKTAEAGLYEIQMEIAALARALGGKTGPRPQ